MARESIPPKIALRATMRERRRGLSAADPGAAERAAALFPIGSLTRFTVVAGYHSVGVELDPAPLLRRLVSAGAKLVLPAAVDRDAPLIFRAADAPERFVPDALGIPSPPASARQMTPDLVIVPVVAFDRRGARLGQGAGCYDRTLEALRAAGAVFALGLAYAGQEVAEVPAEPHDQRLDAILTENGYIEV